MVRMTPSAVLAACVLASCSRDTATTPQPTRPSLEVLPAGGGRPRFVRPPANLDQVAAIIPLGNVNPAAQGGHVRPVKHMYLEYLTPGNGGDQLVEVFAMAPGRIVALLHHQTSISGVGLIDEYEIWIQHTDEVTSYYDHLHVLDPGLGLPEWTDLTAGWLAVGDSQILFLGLNGVREAVRVHPGERLGGTRNYSSNWDIGIVDTRRVGAFLGGGLLRYPTFREFLAQFVSEGGTAPALDPNQPFPGEMFVNSACFLDYMTPPLAAQWRAKLLGDGSCGRPDWDRAGTLMGTWYRADVTTVTLENMAMLEPNAISFSPYNFDPANKVQIGIGTSFVAGWPAGPPIPDALRAAATDRLTRPLQFIPDRTPGTRRNPDPAAVGVGDHACYDIPSPALGGATHRLLVYHHSIEGVEHVELRYGPVSCAILPDWSRFTTWWGDYVR